jgi:hypothetical protein
MEPEDIRHVLDEDPSGSKLANGASHLSPEPRLGMCEARALARSARTLAGEATGDEVNSGNRLSSDSSHVGDDGHSGPSDAEEFSSPLIDLAEPGVLPSGESEPVGEESASVEDAADRGHNHLTARFRDEHALSIGRFALHHARAASICQSCQSMIMVC